MVKGVRVPSAFSFFIAMCVASRTILNPRNSKARITLRLGASTGNFAIYHRHFFIDQKSLYDRGIFIECLCAKCFDMKLNSGFYVRQCLFKSLSLSNDNALQSEWIAHITIGIPLDNNLEIPQTILLSPSICVSSPIIPSNATSPRRSASRVAFVSVLLATTSGATMHRPTCRLIDSLFWLLTSGL